jgi:imidazolonepropionase-like amidohydrolase
MGQKTLLLIIPLILTVGITLVFVANNNDVFASHEIDCTDGEVTVIRVNDPKPICINEETAEKWVSYGIATIVTHQSEDVEESMEKPEVCTMDYTPVCGVDEKTYSNMCMLEGAKVEFAHEGECEIEDVEKEMMEEEIIVVEEEIVEDEIKMMKDEPAKSHGKTLFTNVNIFDGVNDGLQKDMNVLVVENKIQTISNQDIENDHNTFVIDGNGRTLMPGLIDIHSHLAIVKDVRVLENMALDEIAIRTQLAANDWLMDGYTTVRDVGGPVMGLKRVIDSGDVAGPRIFPSGAMLSQTSGHGDWRALNDPNPSLTGVVSQNLERMGFFMIVDGVPDVLAATRQNLMQGATQIKIMAGGGGSSSYDPIDTCQFTPDEIAAIVSAADDWGTYVTAHTFQPRCMQELIELGVKGLDHAFMLDEDTAKMASENNVWILPQMNGVSHYLLENPNLPADKIAVIQKLQENGQKMVDLIKKYNLKTGLATDVLGERDAGSKQRHYELFIHSEFYGNYQTLVHATSMGGELVALSGLRNNYDGKLGVIEEGALADILLVDGNPLDDLSVIGANPKLYDANLEYGVDTILLIMKDGVIYKNTLRN